MTGERHTERGREGRRERGRAGERGGGREGERERQLYQGGGAGLFIGLRNYQKDQLRTQILYQFL